MSDDPDRLADRAHALLAAYRAEAAVPVDVRARVLARVQQSAAVATQAEVARDVASAATGTRLTVIGLALAAAVAAVWFGRELVAPTQVATPSSAVHEHDETTGGVAQSPSATPVRSAAGAPSDAPTAAVPPTTVEPAVITPAVAPATTRAPSPSQPAARSGARPSARTHAADVEIEIDAFADETELLRAAQAARARGDARGAIALLAAGARRFGAGALAEERAALHVLALCDLGRGARARKEAEAFARTYPGSPLLGRVTSACADESSDHP